VREDQCRVWYITHVETRIRRVNMNLVLLTVRREAAPQIEPLLVEYASLL
jgi:hypothetical protein